jgi:hypothetical protein
MGYLPGYYELRDNPGSQQFLASLSADVLKAGINDDHDSVGSLVSVLLFHDRQAALEIGEAELRRNELSALVRATWITALFVIDPSKYLVSWKTLILGPDEVLWESIDLIGDGRPGKGEAVILAAQQRAEIVMLVGQRFANIAHPIGSSDGSRNPWDAAEFVAKQIKLLAADGSPDTDAQLER